MPQANTLTPADLRRVLDYVATRPHAARNRTLLLLSHWAGLRAKELASLRYCDVLDRNGGIKEEIYLASNQTKGRHSRTVYVGSKLRKELTKYVLAVPAPTPEAVLFPTQKNPQRGFSPNTLAQWFITTYRGAGVEASSHSGRRTYLTTLANKGVSIHLLQSLAGHRSITVTARYLYRSPAQLKAAADLI